MPNPMKAPRPSKAKRFTDKYPIGTWYRITKPIDPTGAPIVPVGELVRVNAHSTQFGDNRLGLRTSKGQAIKWISEKDFKRHTKPLR
jgi:hypothetical protein